MSPDPLPLSEEDDPLYQAALTLVRFGLSRQTALRLVGLEHITPDVVNRWVAYCRLRGRDSPHGSNPFLITRLLRNDIPAPSWGALRRLEKKVSSKQ